MNKNHVWWIVISLQLNACGGAALTKLPPPYEEPIATPSDHKTVVNQVNNQSLPEPPAEVVVPKVEPINTANTKAYTVLGETIEPMKKITPFIQQGNASWYGNKFHGRKTASGEIYNMHKLTAAHKTLPIPSYVQVTNEHNQKTIIVRVNDRGPFVKGRIIDLSYAAAQKLDMLGRGTIPVTIQLVDPSQPNTVKPIDTVQGDILKNGDVYLPDNKQVDMLESNPNLTEDQTSTQIAVTSIAGVHGSFVQIGAFKHEQNADALYQRVSNTNIAENTKLNKVYNGDLYQVLLGPYAEYNLAKQASVQMRDQLQLSSIVFSQ